MAERPEKQDDLIDRVAEEAAQTAAEEEADSDVQQAAQQARSMRRRRRRKKQPAKRPRSCRETAPGGKQRKRRRRLYYQPRNEVNDFKPLLLGHLLAAGVGYRAHVLLPEPYFSTLVGLGLTILLLALFKAVHPPPFPLAGFSPTGR